jgi:hypothetical protein
MYQALSYYKIVEGAATYGVNRARAVAKAGGPVAPDVLDSRRVPTDLNHIPNLPEGQVQPASRFGGLSFREFKDQIEDTIRNAVAHLTPGREVRVADYLDDVQACREVVPILRYIARTLIQDELALLPPAHSAGALAS